MAFTEAIRAHFAIPANLGAEHTLLQIAKAVECDDNHRLGIDLWTMVKKTGELLVDKNAEGKNIYRWNDKRERAAAAGKPVKAKGKSRSAAVLKVEKKRGAIRVSLKPAGTSRQIVPAKKSAITQSVKAASRWALTSDGAFIDLTQPAAEIDGVRARELVEFIRKLDRVTV